MSERRSRFSWIFFLNRFITQGPCAPTSSIGLAKPPIPLLGSGSQLSSRSNSHRVLLPTGAFQQLQDAGPTLGGHGYPIARALAAGSQNIFLGSRNSARYLDDVSRKRYRVPRQPSHAHTSCRIVTRKEVLAWHWDSKVHSSCLGADQGID